VWGKDDRITPPEVAERFRALLPSAELTFIANCGHAPMLEQPDSFNAIVEDWLRETHPQRRAIAAGAIP
jgi:pimeloyl-ACP methyl ester carboxylesterase